MKELPKRHLALKKRTNRKFFCNHKNNNFDNAAFKKWQIMNFNYDNVAFTKRPLGVLLFKTLILNV